MSIIYDALKKVEHSTNKDIVAEVNKESRGNKWATYLLYLLVACAGVFAANTIFNAFSTCALGPEPVKIVKPAVLGPLKPAPVKTPTPAPVETPTPAPATAVEAKIEPMIPPLMLNGVFFSNDGNYALINNEVVKQGDSVEGIKVNKVNLDDVELETSTGVKFKLSTQNR